MITSPLRPVLRLPVQQAVVGWTRPLVVGSVVAAVDAYWMLYMEVVWNQGYPTILSLFFNVIFSLTVLLLANSLCRRWRPSWVLAPWELLVVYMMGSAATAVGMWGEYLMTLLTYPYRYGPTNGWTASILPFLPRWLTVSDPVAVKEYYAGNASLYRWTALKPWLLPLACWGICILALVWITLCLCCLVRRQWTESERLAYPITQIPLLMTQPGGSIFRTWLFWIGFSLAAGLNLVNAVHMLLPVVPDLPVKRQGWEWEGLGRPLSALNPILYSWNPFLIGLEFFLPVDLLFSLWFFYVFARFQGVLLSAIGIEQPGMAAESVAPYAREQAFGAIVALLIFAIWASRHSWRALVREIRHGLPSLKRDDPGAGRAHDREPMPPRTAALGVLWGCAVVLLFLLGAGMSWWIAPLFLFVYLVVMTSLTRIRAQFGPPAAGLLLAAPSQVMVGALGTEAFGATGLHGLALFHWVGREFAGHPMPHQLEAFRLASVRGFAFRGVIVAVMLGAAVGLLTAFWGVLHLSYTLGQGTAKVAGTQRYFGHEAFVILASRLGQSVKAPRGDAIAAMLVGGSLTLLLQTMRMRFLGWPFHPVGYALSSTYVSTFLWSTAALTWLFKSLLFRYSGLAGYRTATPFFLGLILGEFVIGSLISISGVLLNVRMYVFWPY